MRPTVLPNPGISAYHAPPGTRLEPLPRKMEPLEFEDPSYLVVQSNFTQNYARPYYTEDDARQTKDQQPAKRQTRVSDRNRLPIARGREQNERSYTYALDQNGNQQQNAR
jgi:hypothetical protein